MQRNIRLTITPPEVNPVALDVSAVCEHVHIDAHVTSEHVNVCVSQKKEIVVLHISDPVAGAAAMQVSSKPKNRLELLDDGLYVRDDLVPDPLAYYILTKS